MARHSLEKSLRAGTVPCVSGILASVSHPCPLLVTLLGEHLLSRALGGVDGSVKARKRIEIEFITYRLWTRYTAHFKRPRGWSRQGVGRDRGGSWRSVLGFPG